MKPLPLLVSLLRQAVQFHQVNGKLKVITPRGVVLSDVVKQEVRANKTEILARLKAPALTTEETLAVFPGATVVSNGTIDTLPDVEVEVCLRCGAQRWWVSRYGVKVCEKCHPPCSASIVVARLPPRHEKAAAG